MASPFNTISKEDPSSVALNNSPKQVYVFVHSHEVSIDFNKKVHLDHFHYRISPYYQDYNAKERGSDLRTFYIRTYDEGRLILDYPLKGN